MRNVAAQNGFDAWRQLSVRYNSYTKGRAITMLTEVLRWEFGALKKFQDKLTEWESIIEVWESQSQERVPDSVTSAVLAEYAPQAVSEHARVNADNLDGQIMRCAVDCVVSKNTGPTPMEVCALVKGKEKCKGKCST